MDKEIIMPETKDIIPMGTTPADLLSIAVQQGADLDKLEKLMQLQERWEANQARKKYITAISEFKKKPLEILKDRKVSFQTSKGKTEYDHASLANVINVISTELSNHGLSAAWKTDQGDFGIKVTCILRHVEGHSEEVSLTAPPDLSGSKNPIQAIASTVSYLERYTLLAITGLTTKDMDIDGGLPENKTPLNDQQAADIETLRKDAGITDSEFKNRLKKRFKVETIDDLSSEQAESLIKALGKTIKEKE